MDKRKVIEKLEDELYLKPTGYTTSIEVFPGGQIDGLDYGPGLIEIVVLDRDGATIAFRSSDDNMDGPWTIGTIEDAVDQAIAWIEEVRADEERDSIP